MTTETSFSFSVRGVGLVHAVVNLSARTGVWFTDDDESLSRLPGHRCQFSKGDRAHRGSVTDRVFREAKRVALSLGSR